MTTDEAIRRLEFHATAEPGAFLEMLRPYRGLQQCVLDDLWSALRASEPALRKGPLPRTLIAALWAISHLTRAWALEDGSMLQRNRLITTEDAEKLGAFLSRFDYAVAMLLDCGDEALAFES